MEQALRLEKLLEGDKTLRTETEALYVANKRFYKLLPQEMALRFIPTGRRDPVTRARLTEILLEYDLVNDGCDPEAATDEALARKYIFQEGEKTGNWGHKWYRDDKWYEFVEKSDGDGNTVFLLEERWNNEYTRHVT